MTDETAPTGTLTAHTSYVLPDDVRIVNVSEYADQLRDLLDLTDDQYVLVRDGSRTPSKLIDLAAASLLACFRPRNTIPGAIRGYAERVGADPAAVLANAFPLIKATVADKILVPADSALADPLRPLHRPGDSVAGWVIDRCVHLAHDCEVHEAHRGAARGALKVSRSCVGPLNARIVHEAKIIQHLRGANTPILLAAGAVESREYLVTQWCPGLPLWVAAAPWRGDASGLGLRRLTEMMLDVVRAYADLHDRGVLHGDIHPDNVLVQPDGRVMIIDFGQATFSDPGASTVTDASRGLTIDFCAPETAAAALSHLPLPSPTISSETYCVGALAHHLLAGVGHLAVSADLSTALQQIVTGEARTLRASGVKVNAALQRALDRALATDASERPSTLRELYEDLDRATRAPERTGAHDARLPRAWADDVLTRFLTFGPQQRTKASSVAHGAAGVSFALMRLADHRNDPVVLAQADSWATHAMSRIGATDSSWAPDMPFPPDVAAGSLYYGAIGTLVVRALVSRALGDEESELDAVEMLVSRRPSPPHPTVELMFGSSGYLLGLSLLLEGPPSNPRADAYRQRLRRVGQVVRDQLWSQLAEQPGIGAARDAGYLGVAHGWAGPLLAAVRWSSATGTKPPDDLRARLSELAALGQRTDGGLRWPVHASGKRGPFRSGWCNGNAGLLHLWMEAADLFGSDDLHALAECTADAICESSSDGYGVCCGGTGMAYALIAMYRRTQNSRWLNAARLLATAESASQVADPELANSLYSGQLGTALLITELMTPNDAAAPMFGRC